MTQDELENFVAENTGQIVARCWHNDLAEVKVLRKQVAQVETELAMTTNALRVTQGNALHNMDRVDTLQAECVQLRDMLTEVLDWFQHAPISYTNGNTHNGLDEGDVLGGELHEQLEAKIKAVLQ